MISGSRGLRDQVQVDQTDGETAASEGRDLRSAPVPPWLPQAFRALCLLNLRSSGQALGTHLPYSSLHPPLGVLMGRCLVPQDGSGWPGLAQL